MPRALERPEWLHDQRFATPGLRARNIDVRLDLIQGILSTAPTAHWIGRLDKERVPCSPVLTRKDMLDNEQVKANDIIVEYNHPKVGKIRQARGAAKFSMDDTTNPIGAPGLGEHSREILLEAGVSEGEIEALVADRVVQV